MSLEVLRAAIGRPDGRPHAHALYATPCAARRDLAQLVRVRARARVRVGIGVRVGVRVGIGVGVRVMVRVRSVRSRSPG